MPSSSNHKRNPPRSHSLHVSRIMRISAQEIFLHQALDGDEPKNAEAHEDHILWAERTQQESEGREQASGVHRMSHVGVSASVDECSLSGNKTDVASQTQARPDNDQQACHGDYIRGPVPDQRMTLLQKAENQKIPVGRDKR